MNRLLMIVSIFMFFNAELRAQKKHYLYVHNTNNQQFNLKLDHRIYISDASGNLIIPKLDSGNIQFSILAFKENEYNPSFEFSLNDQNQGWNLNINSTSTTLENWITKDIIYPNSNYTTENWWNGTKKKDNFFAQMMSDLVADTAVLYNTNTIIPSVNFTEISKVDPRLSMQELASNPTKNNNEELGENNLIVIDSSIGQTVDTVKNSLLTSVIKSDSLFVDTISIAKQNVERDTSFLNKLENPITPKVVKNIFEVEIKKDTILSTGRLIEYSIKDSGEVERVEIIIPIETAKITNDQKTEVVNIAEKTIVDKLPTISTIDEKDTDTLFQQNVRIMYNSDCKEIATDADIDKYRVKLLTLNQEQRFNQMSKYLKSKCITSKQIKALSELFTTDDDRYKFFEMTYPYVEETTTFKLLIDLLESNLNKTKFRQLTRM